MENNRYNFDTISDDNGVKWIPVWSVKKFLRSHKLATASINNKIAGIKQDKSIKIKGSRTNAAFNYGDFMNYLSKRRTPLEQVRPYNVIDEKTLSPTVRAIDTNGSKLMEYLSLEPLTKMLLLKEARISKCSIAAIISKIVNNYVNDKVENINLID